MEQRSFRLTVLFLFSGNTEIFIRKTQVIASLLVVYGNSWPILN